MTPKTLNNKDSSLYHNDIFTSKLIAEYLILNNRCRDLLINFFANDKNVNSPEFAFIILMPMLQGLTSKLLKIVPERAAKIKNTSCEHREHAEICDEAILALNAFAKVSKSCTHAITPLACFAEYFARSNKQTKKEEKQNDNSTQH